MRKAFISLCPSVLLIQYMCFGQLLLSWTWGDLKLWQLQTGCVIIMMMMMSTVDIKFDRTNGLPICLISNNDFYRNKQHHVLDCIFLMSNCGQKSLIMSMSSILTPRRISTWTVTQTLNFTHHPPFTEESCPSVVYFGWSKRLKMKHNVSSPNPNEPLLKESTAETLLGLRARFPPGCLLAFKMDVLTKSAEGNKIIMMRVNNTWTDMSVSGAGLSGRVGIVTTLCYLQSPVK